MTCKHRLEEIMRNAGAMSDSVVRWCSECGAVVVDEDYDGRTNAGAIMKMRLPKVAGNGRNFQTLRAASYARNLEKAIAWLTDALHSGPRDAETLFREARAAEGITESTLRLAKDYLKITHTREFHPLRPRYMWSLPAIEATEVKNETPTA